MVNSNVSERSLVEAHPARMSHLIVQDKQRGAAPSFDDLDVRAGGLDHLLSPRFQSCCQFSSLSLNLAEQFSDQFILRHFQICTDFGQDRAQGAHFQLIMAGDTDAMRRSSYRRCEPHVTTPLSGETIAVVSMQQTDHLISRYVPRQPQTDMTSSFTRLSLMEWGAQPSSK